MTNAQMIEDRSIIRAFALWALCVLLCVAGGEFHSRLNESSPMEPFVGGVFGFFVGPLFAICGHRKQLGSYIVRVIGISVLAILIGFIFDYPAGIWFISFCLAILFAALFSRSRDVVVNPISFICTECEYNLYGNISGKCPECGKLISADQRNFIQAIDDSDAR